MNLLLKLKAMLIAGAASLFATFGSASAGDDKAFVVLDILPLKHGASVEDAQDYLRDIEPILARHGMTRTGDILTVEKVMRGSLNARVVNLWATDNPEASFSGVFSDKEYKQNLVPRRDRIFDLQKATIVVTKRVTE